MDPCYPLAKTSSVSSALTVAHLIRNIEQLKNKDKLISQLEKDLGRQSWGAAAHFAVLERRRSEGSPLPPGGLDLSPPFRTLPEGSDDPKAFPWTPTSIQSPGDVEDVWTNNEEEIPLGKRDLSSQLKGTNDRNKELVDKCRSFLQQNKELSAQNRAFQESTERASEDSKKAQGFLEHSKLQLLQLSRQLNQLKAERMEWEQQARQVEGLRQERMEDKKMINALRKACSDKDRRIELIQHRKRRRRMIESAEKTKIQRAGLKETPFGYEEDDSRPCGDGDHSVCSLSSTISDDSTWDEVLSKEEMERNYQRLMLEQLELQKAHALLQMQTDNLQDPQRENLSKTDLQNDLFLAQCRIEQLEHYITENIQGQSDCTVEEREMIQNQNKHLNSKVKDLQLESKRLKKELSDMMDKNEEMEFRLIELEQISDSRDGKEEPCPDTKSAVPELPPLPVSQEPSSPLPLAADASCSDSETERTGQQMEPMSQGMEQLYRQLRALLKDRGRDAELALNKMNAYVDKEKALESMAHDLQMKVISLQQEKNALQDRLLLVEQSKPGKGGHSVSLVEARERQENLALKAAIESQSQLVSERSTLQGELDDIRTQNETLRNQIDTLLPQQPVIEDFMQQSSVSDTQASALNMQDRGSPPTKKTLLSRKLSDRKSKSRDKEEHPTVTKRRKNAADNEYDKNNCSLVRKFKSVGDIKSAGEMNSSGYMVVDDDSGSLNDVTDSEEEKDVMQVKISQLEQEITNVKCCNDDMITQLQQSVHKKLELESSHQVLQEKIISMEQDLDLLHRENVALGEQLRQRVEEFQFSQDERNPRVSELEEFIEDLQDRLKEAENCERLLREKLKLFEKSVEESESQEMMMRERCEQLLAGDNEARKQIHVLQSTELELRDIVLEKEIVEQALREKVDFLQKAEAASVQRIEELEGIVEDLRQQLEEKMDGKGQRQREAHKLTEMKHQMTFLETDNKALSARVAELEENEEILRENWRRVADEDFNRTQCLEEKVKMLEGANRDLKQKLTESQECLMIDMSKSNLSLAAELAESESKIFDDSSDEEGFGGQAGLDQVDSPALHQEAAESEQKVMREKLRKLERQLSEVSEKKNTKIETLQEQLVDLKETEIKLSETISEMEMTEREHRAKLALYESSEITVEKMLKYQSKIEELRTSQESLLDQLEIKENQEMTLQEKMQELERTLRGKIVSLEVEMKSYKKRELQSAGLIRELEKHESELSEKVAQQAEKENGLYVKISSLMDELKAAKTELETVKKQIEEKEDKVRQAKLLEVKLLEIEMECGKKVSTLNAKLRHREEEFRQKESAYEEQISELRTSHGNSAKLEDEFAQREHQMQQEVIEKESVIANLMTEVSELRNSSSEELMKMSALNSELEKEKQKVCEKESVEEDMKVKVQHLETIAMEKETEYKKEKQCLEREIKIKEEKVLKLDEELHEALQRVVRSELDESDLKAAGTEVSKIESFCDNFILDVENKVSSRVLFLENKLQRVESCISDFHGIFSEKCRQIHELEVDNEEQQKMFEKDVFRLEQEKDDLENELKSRLHALNSELEEEMKQRESKLSALLKDSQEKEASLKFDVSNLQHQVEQHKRELITKLSELESKNKSHCELTLELSNIRHELKSVQKDYSKSKQSYLGMQATFESKEDELDQAENKIIQLNGTIERLKSDIKEKDVFIKQISSEKESIMKENDVKSDHLISEKTLAEKQYTEKCQEIEKVHELHLQSQKELLELKKTLDNKKQVIQKHEQEKGEKEQLLRESQTTVQSVQEHKNNLTRELTSSKSLLEEARDQISTQQHELQALQTELQSQTVEVYNFKTMLKDQENQLQEKDQKYEELSVEMKSLHRQVEERSQTLEHANSRVADVKQKLQKAEHRVRELETMQVSLEMRLEERYTVSQDAEKVLLSKETQFKQLESQLDVSEKNLANLKDQLSVKEESSKDLTQRLEAKEIECDEQYSELIILKENFDESNEKYLSLKSEYQKMGDDFEELEARLKEDKQTYDEMTFEKDTIIQSLESKLHDVESSVTKLQSELASTQEKLEDKNKNYNDFEMKIMSKQHDYDNVKLKHDGVVGELEDIRSQLKKKKLECDELLQLTGEKDSQLSILKAESHKSAQELANQVSKDEEREKRHSEKVIELENLVKENMSLKEDIEKLTSERDTFQIREEERNKTLISQLQLQKSELATSLESLQTENADLNERIQHSEQSLHTANKQCSEFEKKTNNLSKQLSEAEIEMQKSTTRTSMLEAELSTCTKDRDQALRQADAVEVERQRLETDNIQLQKEIEEAAKEFQSLAQSFEESKTSIENRVQEISDSKQKVEQDYESFQKKHSYKISGLTEELKIKERTIVEIQERCNHLVRENTLLTANVDSLKLELSQAQVMTKPTIPVSEVEEEIVCATNMRVDMAPNNFSNPSSEIGKKVDPSNKHGKDGTDSTQQISQLESDLEGLKRKETQLQKRVSELETIEKDLREQIVDIEVTVIVPLETENQELKDEISIAIQERDEAISKITKWDEDEDETDGGVQNSETVHQKLEDALILCEELENKNSILLNDIHKVENENESLREKITDFDLSEKERKDEIECLEAKIADLHEVHQDASVLEETETTLMDRVLDLEERERLLTQELESMKETLSQSGGDGNEVEDVNEKMKYLEQKNQILLDAEGRYMDKIMELEEDKHRLLTELSSLTSDVSVQKSQSHHIPHPSVNKLSVSSSTQTSVPLDSNTATDATEQISFENTLCLSNSSPGQTISSSSDERVQNISVLEDQLKESQTKLEELDSKLREKDAVVLYLQDKMELLKDSEGKLMDKLLEAEEKASSLVHSTYASEIAELQKRFDQTQEENEFLAENVEQYKTLYKEQKEINNDLQDRLMEDTSNASELHRTQDELAKTQQMVEEIQSEYEEQLSGNEEEIIRFKEELDKAGEKMREMEEVLVTMAKREGELQEILEGMKATEKDLRSRLALVKVEDDESAMSDSGLSADDPRARNDDASLKESEIVESPVIHRSVKTLFLSKTAAIPGSDPVPLPRIKRKLRLQSIEKVPHEDLVCLVQDLQEREAALNKTVTDLQAPEDNNLLSQKVIKLQSEKKELERRLSNLEDQNVTPDDLSSKLCQTAKSPGYVEITDAEKDRDSGKCVGLDRSSTSDVLSTVAVSATMLEKLEDVLQQRIKELEGLDKHNKNTVSELERDREVLHEIARRDKASIHDLNVRIRELQLSERSLKEQVTNLEVSENSLFTKCEDLEALRAQLEDRVHELEIHERRLRELVRKLKLDEERWFSKSDGMENAVAELSANEAQLKRLVQDIEIEKGGISERAEYLEARVRELESVEVALLTRIKDYENNEVTLQNRLVQLENAEAAAHSRTSELDMLNVNLAQKHKKMVDENAVMSQHLAQLHGQVQDLDRRLLSSRDSEIAYKQHVESLQKNESMLQKKVREYELREIDSQSAIRELEQTMEICNDKVSALQRSENRLKYRVQELEGVGGQIPGELTPSQQQKIPQKIEDCQKQVVVLQAQVEHLKLQLRQALQTTQQQPAVNDEEDKKERESVKVDMEEYRQLHAKAALLEEYAYQNGELESNQEQLRDVILQLRHGKGACGHEVEIEVYKRRIESLQTLMDKLKSSLTSGQTTSLLDPDNGSGPQGETLPARHLQVLESERVLQSVRGLHHDGKADTTTTTDGGVHSAGLAQVEETMVQAEAVRNMASPPISMAPLEESHWKAIEARKPVTSSAANDSRGGVSAVGERETKPVSSSPSHRGKQRSSTAEVEEVTGVLNLASESELSSYHRTTQNDTDSSCSPIAPPRRHRGNRLGKNLSDDNSSNSGSGSEYKDHHHHPSANTATANQKHFVCEKSLPLTASNIEKQCSQQQSRTPLSRFAEDSFYLPSSTQEGVDSLDDDESPPPLPSNGPPGQDTATLSGCSSRASSTYMQEERESLDNSTSGLSIRERIALIEKHLQSDAHTSGLSNREEEDQLFYWKRKSTENLRQVENLDKNNKFLKEDITRLEKELEEKRRYINTLELWLSSTEDLLRNKTKQTDREMVEQLQLDLQKLRRELTQSGYRNEDASPDPAALKTELEHKDREISSKRMEIDSLAQELRRCHKECRSIEGMRRNALDSLRALEKELLHLQDTDEKLKKAHAEISTLKVQYDELDQFKNQALAMVQPLQVKVDRLANKCRDKDVLLRRLGAELRRGLHRPSSALDELTRLERAMNGEEYNTDNSDNLSDDLSPRLPGSTTTNNNNSNRLRGRSVSMDELSLNSDTDSFHLPPGMGHSPVKRQRPTPYVNTRPRSAEAGGSLGLRSPRGGVPIQASPRSGVGQPAQRAIGQYPRRGFDLAHEHFIAIADYDPGLYSQSGRPRLELSLREGDHVRVVGPMDRQGYCEAECNGRTGLVPANYLQQVHYSDMNGHGRPPSAPPSSLSASRSSPFPLDRDIEPPMEFQDRSPKHSVLNGSSSRLSGLKSSPRLYKDGGGMQQPVLPDPPSNLHVRGVQEGCLVLQWNPPPLDLHGCNKGLAVMGYMVYVDNQEYQHIPNPQFCQAMIEVLNPSMGHHLGVQCLCSGGLMSPRAELLFEGLVRLGGDGLDQEKDGQEPLDTDLSSVLNSIHYTKGLKKKVMALYEYNPEQQSPHDYTAFELPFHAGDIIAVYGEPRPDGFYHGEIEGTRGLVPACFVEDLSSALGHGKQGSEDSGHESSKA